MKRPIYQALEQILKFKESTTVSEISKISGLKQLDVLIVLNNNQHLFKRDKKTGKITGWHDLKSIQRSEAFKNGKTYRVIPINYGSASELSVGINTEFTESLKENYICGGFGDSYSVSIIIDNEKNRKLLEKVNIVNEFDYKTKTISEMWKE